MSRTLIVTNDFPPRQGGIETFASEMARRFPPESIVVYTSAERGAAAYDASLPFPVIRDRSRTLLPTGRVMRKAGLIALEHDCDTAWIAAAAPLGLIAPALRACGVKRVVATTHGHETWWAKVPLTRWGLRTIGRWVDVMTYISGHTYRAILPAVTPDTTLVRLSPGVDVEQFTPAHSSATDPGPSSDGNCGVIVCTARLVPRKGQDSLIRALPAVLERHPDTKLLLVGDGPDRRRLQRLTRTKGVETSVTFVGGLPHALVPQILANATIFAMPCRTRRLGLEEEGLGIAYLEASAMGLPIIVGDSGGAPETVQAGHTGYVVTDVEQLTQAIVELLDNPARARAMGECGRNWVAAQWTWHAAYATLLAALFPNVDVNGQDRSSAPQH
ncbi:glycosyltransferase family 4 protein [Rhodococcus sp. H29-C3]|uniref:glycosyltransferase family 4 protein n=1 Tax=Rhodococcus sp. H29-C3 TaxID=3046307 RepID=UPI0024B9D91E|nr:glycosyltransferase family 4 protein [Rhodococcus sp. H29-C3]MDJ0363104.1 glycosyltransferase family 4 protein [Rhodococcus sp. H29-C3]